MFSSDLSPRLLALPTDVRAALAGVAGPGWRVSRTGHAILQPSPDPHELMDGYAWFSVNPAAAVAAVLGCEPWAAFVQIGEWMRGIAGIEHATEPGLDADAALSIIEAHVASRSTHDPR